MDESRQSRSLRNACSNRDSAGLHGVKRYEGAYFLHKDGEVETEFVALTLFEKMEAVRAFAGEDYEAAVVSAESRKLLASSTSDRHIIRLFLGPE